MSHGILLWKYLEKNENTNRWLFICVAGTSLYFHCTSFFLLPFIMVSHHLTIMPGTKWYPPNAYEVITWTGDSEFSNDFFFTSPLQKKPKPKTKNQKQKTPQQQYKNHFTFRNVRMGKDLDGAAFAFSSQTEISFKQVQSIIRKFTTFQPSLVSL